MQFYQILDNYMNENELSNYKMSQETGISDSLIGYWRRGKRKPSLDNLIALSKYMNVSIDYLVFGTIDTSNKLDTSNMLANNELNEDEAELLKNYKHLDRRGQYRIHTVIYEEIDRFQLTKDLSSKKGNTG